MIYFGFQEDGAPEREREEDFSVPDDEERVILLCNPDDLENWEGLVW